MKRLLIFPMLLLISILSFSQLRQIPKEVRENFSQKYPAALEVNYDDDLFDVNVHFTLDGEKMKAAFSNKGVWKYTEKKWTIDKLPDAVKDGFSKSRYADRELKDVVIIYYPGNLIQYRLKTEKSAVEKKYLYFNPEGRLLRESITI
jgi:hypothetical protein